MINQGFTIQDQGAGVIAFSFTRSSSNDEDSTQVAHQATEQLDAALRNYDEREALVLVEFNDDDGVVSKEALGIYSELLKHPKIMRMAIYGGLAKYRQFAKLALPFTNLHMIKIFDTKSEAMHWLINS